ncbi:PREDICTED: glycine N-phenylacetyltransferase-like [Ceratotherium simum simum]|uniref:Glycine N-acyltransferase-like protein n=1 Tax=Ceratotherium simum simum TaxID=73337 RepID=A0ABM1D9X6_CERSS|nr:PREDICTED: glycine N-phenylacetyltransferase-like [Ceratotherium simum simum]
MFHLQGPQMLQMLEKSLRKSLPESLKVYGTVFHMNQGNPFKLKALVDKWPDFRTVVIRPQEQEMTDDFDHYTNSYQIYSKDPKNCQEVLAASDIINWKQHLQIQSSQSSLDEVIQNLGTTKLVKVKQTQRLLYVMPETARKLLPSLPETKNLPLQTGTPKAVNQEMFKFSSLDVTHAPLVNKFWHLAKRPARTPAVSGQEPLPGLGGAPRSRRVRSWILIPPLPPTPQRLKGSSHRARSTSGRAVRPAAPTPGALLPLCAAAADSEPREAREAASSFHCRPALPQLFTRRQRTRVGGGDGGK